MSARLLLLLFVVAVALAPDLGGCSPSASAAIDAPDCTMADVPGVAVAPKAPLAAPNLPLVQGASVGSLPGSGHVGGTGEYNYTVPIEVPAGRAGMQPTLSLTYSSRGSNGHVGAGFSLAGLSEITHCARTVATDGYREGPSYNDDDRLCLDGHVLVPIGPHPAGTEYRTEDETFSRIVARRPDKEHIDGFIELKPLAGHPSNGILPKRQPPTPPAPCLLNEALRAFRFFTRLSCVLEGETCL